MAGEREALAKIFEIQEKRKLAVVALCKYYAKLVIEDFQAKQENDYYWNNQSGFAKDLMFAEEFEEKNIIGFFMAHGVEYGPSLELANDRQNEALRPTIEKFLPKFKEDLNKIW